MYGVVKLAALSAALAATLVTLTEGARFAPGAQLHDIVRSEGAPSFRNAPLAVDECAEELSAPRDDGCPGLGARLAPAPTRLAFLDRPIGAQPLLDRGDLR